MTTIRRTRAPTAPVPALVRTLVPALVPTTGQAAPVVENARDQTGPDVAKQPTNNLAELLRFVLDDAPPSVAVTIVPPPCGLPGDIVAVAGGAPTVGMINLRVVVTSPGGLAVFRRGATGPAVDPEALGHRLTDDLLFARARTLMGIC